MNSGQAQQRTRTESGGWRRVKERLTPKWWKKLFFVIRRPRLFGMTREWIDPRKNKRLSKQQAEALYDRLMVGDGFLCDSLFRAPEDPEEDVLSMIYGAERRPNTLSSELQQAVGKLEKHLLPHFWKITQQAKYYQNMYYLFQWVFIIGAFLTTVLAAANVYYHDNDFVVRWLQFLADPLRLRHITATALLGFVTALISGLTAAVATMSAGLTPRKRWFMARAKAERLRSFYFLFLAQQGRFAVADEEVLKEGETSLAAEELKERKDEERVTRLRRAVLEVLKDTRKEGANE